MQLLGIELRTSRRQVSAPNGLAISPGFFSIQGFISYGFIVSWVISYIIVNWEDKNVSAMNYTCMCEHVLLCVQECVCLSLCDCV